MTLPESIGFCVLLVGVVGFAAKLSIDGEPLDVLALVACATWAGYLGANL